MEKENRTGKSQQIKVYDFKRPDKFSKDQIRTLMMIFETFARLCTASISAMLRTMSHVYVRMVDQMTYEEFVRSLPMPTLINIINFSPLPGSIIYEIDSNISFSLLDRVFGGRGEALKTAREATDIELSVMEGFVTRILKNFGESWYNVIELNPQLIDIETNPQFALIVPPNSMIISVQLEARIGEVSGNMNIAIPYITLEPVMYKLSAKYWYSGIKPESQGNNIMAASRIKTLSEIAIRGEDMSVNKIFSLKKGSLIRLPGFEKGIMFLRSGGNVVATLKQRKKTGRKYDFIPDETENINILEFENRVLSRTAEKQKPENADGMSTFRSFSEEMKKSLEEIGKKIAGLTDQQNVISERINFNSIGHSDPAESAEARPFEFLNELDSNHIGLFLSNEHPQLVALILSYVESGIASEILPVLGDNAPEIIRRIAGIDRISPEVIKNIERVLIRKFNVLAKESYDKPGGVKTAADILNHSSRSIEKSVIGELEINCPELASELKQNMFVFEDIILMDEKNIRKVLEETDIKTLSVALKSVSEKVKEYFFLNMGENESEAVKTAMRETGAIRLNEVENAQQKIIGIIRKMEESGEIIVFRADERIIE